MVRYSDDILDEIKTRNDIVDVISQYVTLKRKGRNFFGICPFHNEKSPSFSVSPDKQIFHCFGCGVGGNVFHFISKIENINFVESIQLLAERAHIELPKSSSVEDEKIANLKAKVYQVNQEAAQFYHENLYKPSSKIAQEYIKKRKLDNNTLKSFLIGYAGDNNELFNFLKSKGFGPEEMLASSLIGKTESGRFYDKFKHRLMFPIQDIRNKVIAFGGRVLDDSKPKYINSPENIVYSKGRNLFGLNVAKSKQSGVLKRILIVEGYMDVISLHQRGITNVVASLGTALTDAQGRLLRKNSEQVILGYDADGAGQTAIVRGMEILKNMGVDIRVLQISGAKDPDEFVIKYGPEKFVKCMDNSISIVEYKVKNLVKNLNIENTSDKIKFLNETAKILAEVQNTMEREIYIDKISKTYDISKIAIEAEINKKIYNGKVSEKVLEKRSVTVAPKDSEKIDEATNKREQMLIFVLINYCEKSYERIKNAVDLNCIKIEKNKEILNTLFEKGKENINAENVIDLFSDEEMVNYISGILAYDFEIDDVDKAIEDIEKIYLKERKIARKNEIISMLDNKNNLQDSEVEKLESELNNVIIELARMK